MSEFRILFLSDAHIGNPKWSTDRDAVLDPLLNDIEREKDAFGQPELVVFGGDLVYGFENGKPMPFDDQFNLAGQWLDKLNSRLGRGNGRLPLFLVPGNHDVDRDLVLKAQRKYTDQLSEEDVDNLLYSKDADWQGIMNRLQRWKQFAFDATQNTNTAWDRDWLLSHRVFDVQGGRIGLAGLNTAWASYSAEDRSKLWIGNRQLQEADRVLRDADFKIVIGHHPTSWLHPSENPEAGYKIQALFNMHLHGHEHLNWIQDARGHLRVAAGACYQGSRNPASYCWIGIDFANRKVRLRLRRWEHGAATGWVSYPLPGLTDNEGNHSTDLPFNKNGANSSSNSAGPSARLLNSGNLATVEGGFAFCKAIKEKYEALWELPGPSQGPDLGLVYWPVRLRQPNVVHAAQAFIAGGLQRRGAEVYLWLDDVGEVDPNAKTRFTDRVLSWIKKVGGDAEKISVKSMRELLETDKGKNIWATIRKWFAEQQTHRLAEVLHVAKLIRSADDPTTEELKELLGQEPKRLLNPPIVWTCLVNSLESKPEGGVITLGGVDELPLWSAWERRITPTNREIGHLYVSTLLQGAVPYSMNAASQWAGEHHISEALKRDLALCGSESEFLRNGGMPFWCYQHCVALPNSLQMTTIQEVPTWQAFKESGATEVMRTLPDFMAKWLFQ